MSNKPIIAVTMGDPVGNRSRNNSQGARRPDNQKELRDPLILGRLGRAATHPWRQAQLPQTAFVGSLASSCCPCSIIRARSRFARYRRSRRARSRPGVASKPPAMALLAISGWRRSWRLSKVANAIATAPISKSILIDAGYNYPGHTELLAELSRTPECRMMLIGRKASRGAGDRSYPIYQGRAQSERGKIFKRRWH